MPSLYHRCREEGSKKTKDIYTTSNNHEQKEMNQWVIMMILQKVTHFPV